MSRSVTGTDYAVKEGVAPEQRRFTAKGGLATPFAEDDAPGRVSLATPLVSLMVDSASRRGGQSMRYALKRGFLWRFALSDGAERISYDASRHRRVSAGLEAGDRLRFPFSQSSFEGAAGRRSWR